MSDSFFTSRNRFDLQVEDAPIVLCGELIDAVARRTVKLEGPIEASKRLQRLADICAGAYVLPIEHWKSLGAPQPVDPDEPSKSRKGRVIEVVAAHGHWFAAGMLFNMLLSALPWIFR